MDSDNSSGSLIYAASEICADLLYSTGFSAPDPFLWYSVAGERGVVVSALEVSRADKQCHSGIKVLSYFAAAQLWGLDTSTRPRAADYILALSRHHRITHWRVPASFPYGLASELLSHDLTLLPQTPFQPARARKTDAEIEFIRHSVKLAEKGLEAALGVLRQAEISDDGLLYWQQQPLLAETLIGAINAEIARHNGAAAHTIAAHGTQAADPHQTGHGQIKANTPIVLDIFPRDLKSGYFGDLTRTVVKGRAPDIVHQAYAAVLAAQQAAQAKLAPGVGGDAVHQAAMDKLVAAGFHTEMNSSPPRGFFHSTGHGLGLEIHEAPSLSQNATGPLQDGNVITVEPGLYYPEWGGVRIEDVMAIKTQGAENLTTAAKFLEIP